MGCVSSQMIDSHLSLLHDAKKSLGWRFPLLLVAIPVSAFVEGLGLLLLFPLLSQLGIGSSEGTGPIGELISSLFRVVGIEQSLLTVLVIVAVTLQLQVLLALLRNRLEAYCMASYEGVWKQRLFEGFIGASWRHSMQEPTAAQSNAILTESGRIAAALNMTVQIISASVLTAIYAIVSIAAAWQIVAFLCFFGGLIYFALRPLSKRGISLGEHLSIVSERLNHVTHEFLSNIKLVKVTASEDFITGQVKDILKDFQKAQRDTAFHPALVQQLYMAVGYLTLCVGVWLSVSVLDIAPTAIIIALYVFLRLYNQLAGIQSFLQTRAMMFPAMLNAGRLLSAALENKDTHDQGIMPDHSQPVCISLENATFYYEDAAALNNLSLVVTPGKMIGVTGPSGAGKSTFVDLVAGLIPPSDGNIKVDGISLSKTDLSAWRKQIGYVAQDTLLMRTTIAENIAWGSPDATIEDIRAAAKMANAHEFIDAMPKGYETIIGGRGVRLSGGQRQRLGLARALLGKKRLIILDEATSALDSESENQVIKAVEGLRGTVTVLSIAHRLSSLQKMDRILVFQDGQITEDGNFESLIAQDGHFASLWKQQALQMDGNGG